MKKIMFCDTETHSLYGEVCMFQYVGLNGDAKIKEYPSYKWMKKFIKKHHTVWYNFSYDGGTIGMDTIDYSYDDLFYAGRSAFPELPRYSLDVLHDYLGMNYYDSNLDKKKMQKSFTTAVAKKARKATPEQIAYGKADVYTLRELYKNKKIQKIIQKNKAYSLDIESLKYSLIYQKNGIPVDRVALAQEKLNLVDSIESNYKILNGLNPNSPKQCKEALGTVNTSKETLVKLISEGNTLAKVIFEQRRLLKARGMLESWDYDRIYTFFNPAGAVTGRFTSSGGDVDGAVNAQQITRKYQYMFHSPKGKTTFEIDYGTAELRAGCSIMRDKKMYEELMEGKDLHIEACREFMGIPEPTKAERTGGKAVSFGLIFGMSAPAFQEYAFTEYGTTFSARRAKKIRDGYHKKYQGISSYAQARWRDYKSVPVVTAMGRRNIANMGTDAINYATQGSIAEATKWSVVYLVRKYGFEALRVIVNVVHDAVYIDCPDKDFDMWSKRLDKAMQKGWKKICKSDLFFYKDIPMPTEVEKV